MGRDLVKEILEFKARGGHVDDAVFEAITLDAEWIARTPVRARTNDDFYPMRAVTLLEVFVKTWITRLIDHGSPYAENAAGLAASGVKFDYNVALALRGKKLSMGELVAHGLPVNRIEDVAGPFSTVLGRDIFALIETTVDRFKVERQDEPRRPIVQDMKRLRARIAELFRVRHILTHELPKTKPYAPNDVEGFLGSVVEFMQATDQALRTQLFGHYPLTPMEMAEDYGRRLALVESALQAALDQIAQRAWNVVEHQQAQERWTSFANAQVSLVGSTLEGGSLQAVAMVAERLRLTVARVADVTWWLEKRDGTLWRDVPGFETG